jgi:hypothetical protein
LLTIRNGKGVNFVGLSNDQKKFTGAVFSKKFGPSPNFGLPSPSLLMFLLMLLYLRLNICFISHALEEFLYPGLFFIHVARGNTFDLAGSLQKE